MAFKVELCIWIWIWLFVVVWMNYLSRQEILLLSIFSLGRMSPAALGSWGQCYLLSWVVLTIWLKI